MGAHPLSRTGMPEITNITTSKAALLGRDFPGIRFEVLVQVGDPVSMGQPLMRDRRRPDVVFTAPAAGRVSNLSRGPKRSIVSVQIDTAHDAGVTVFNVEGNKDAADIRDLLLRSGLWTALRQRPFDIIPDPHGAPTAILVTAMDTEPFAPDPAEIIALQRDEFIAGVKALATLADAPVFVCNSPGADLPQVNTANVKPVEFSGPHPAGLPGTHIRKLCPIGFSSNTPWHIGYQDVISVGYLVNTGRIAQNRTVSVCGPALSKPILCRVTLGGHIGDILDQVTEEGVTDAISGSPLTGHRAIGDVAFLGQRHRQITVLNEAVSRKPWWKTLSLFEITPAEHKSPLIPTTDLDQAALSGILTVPMMRALLVGDVERARALGALELTEEDVAMWGFLCPSKTDYGSLLRKTLNQLQKDQQAVAG